MRKVRHRFGGFYYANCWVMGIIFLVRNFGRIKKVMIRRNHTKKDKRDSNVHVLFQMKTGSIAHYTAPNKTRFYPLLMFVTLEVFKHKYLRKEADYKVILNKRS